MSDAPYTSKLPKAVDPRKFAQQQIDLKGFIQASELERLTEGLDDQEGMVQVDMQFRVDEERNKVIEGGARCDLVVPCQRCLQPMTISVEAEFSLAVVWDEDAAKNLPRRLDPLIAGEGQMDLYQAIEDELLLAMPMVSYHEEPCIESTQFGDADDKGDESKAPNPFQVLEQLKGSPK